MTQMDMEACMKAGMPGENHKLLGQFIGTWKAKVSMWMEPGAEPMVSTGVMKNTWALGNRFVRHDYKGDAGDFQGEGYFGFNNATGNFEGVWLDAMDTAINTDTGHRDDAGKVWTMSGEGQMPGGPVFTRRSVTTVHGPDRHTMEMFMSTPEGESKVMEIEYTRA